MQTWIYKQNYGYIIAPGSIIAAGIGWAGQGKGRNNPDMQDVPGVGPIPCGWYTITEPFDSPHTGKYTLGLVPDKGNQMFGRGDFRIHGASAEHPETSSEGCIIQTRYVRTLVWDSGVRRLQVVRGEALREGPKLS